MTLDQQHPGLAAGRSALAAGLLLAALMFLGFSVSDLVRDKLPTPGNEFAPGLGLVGVGAGISLWAVIGRMKTWARVVLAADAAALVGVATWLGRGGCYSDGIDSGACPFNHDYEAWRGVLMAVSKSLPAVGVLLVACGLAAASRWISRMDAVR